MTNLLKKYPELLDLACLDEYSRKNSLRRIFDRDIADNDKFSFLGKRIYPIKSDGKVDMDREFMHLTTEETIDENNDKSRTYDCFRSERLHWIKTHVEQNVKDSKILVFSVKERDQRKRVDVTRTYLFNETRKYVVVFEPQRDGTSYFLLTAYYLNRDYGEKQIKGKYKKRLENTV